MEAPQNSGIILLTGPKHSGKTSAGRALSALWKGPFIDLDELIEQRTGKSPRTLFREGPEVFRQAEAAVLEDLILKNSRGPPPPYRRPLVLAAGGGLVDNPAALALLKGAGNIRIVYLEVSPETAWERVSRSAAQTGELPPFLNTADPRSAHFGLHTRRAEEYKKTAHHTIQADGKSPEQIAADILNLFQD